MPDRLRYALHPARRLQHCIDQSRQILARAFATCQPWSVSVSFGKDSCVLLDLVRDLAPEIPVLFVDRGAEAELPETSVLIEHMQARRPFTLHVVEPTTTLWQLYRRLGGIPGLSSPASESLVRTTTLLPPAEAWMARQGIAGCFLGRRAEENPRTRGKHLHVRGALHRLRTTGRWVCDPLAWWTGADIWAYIVAQDLPYHPVYDHPWPGGRERIRQSSWSGMAGASWGRFAFVKRYYPALFALLVAQFPEVASYG